MPIALRQPTISTVLLLLSLCIFAKNFWLNEDAYIVFRSLEQLLAGHGAVWNTGERVQVYTSVAWYWLLAAVNAVLHDVFASTIGVTVVLFLMLLALARRLHGDTPALWLVLALWLLSKGFFDYTSSGLENVLAYIVLLALYGAYHALATDSTDATAPRRHYVIAALTGLLPLVRHDLTLLGAVPFALLLWRARRDWRCVFCMLGLALAPLALWTLTSLVYYGLPLPNTAYAKLKHGFEHDLILQTGRDYFYWNARLDPATLLVIVVAPIIALLRLHWWQRGFALGLVLYCLYLYQSGGDYMAGRFLSFPFLVGTLLIANWLQRITLPRAVAWPALAVVAAYLWLIPATPIITPWIYGRDVDAAAVLKESLVTGALNQRLLHYQTTPAAWWRNERRAPGVLETFRRDGENLGSSSDKVAVRGALGTTGYYAGLNVHIVDFFALTDPLLAQLPAVRRQVSGHFAREVVTGYVERLRDGVSPIQDAGLNQYYQYIELLTRNPELFSAKRLKTIIAFNLGRYDSLLDAYRRDVAARRVIPSKQEY